MKRFPVVNTARVIADVIAFLFALYAPIIITLLYLVYCMVRIPRYVEGVVIVAMIEILYQGALPLRLFGMTIPLTLIALLVLFFVEYARKIVRERLI